MHSTFNVSKSQCMTCTNEVLKQLGTLRGVFGAEVNRIDGQIVVHHTDEISRKTIGDKLDELGWKELTEEVPTDELEYDEPSSWGCAL